MRKNNTNKSKLEPFVLPILCVVTALLLAVTNAVTKPLIDEASVATQNAIRQEVLPQADGFEALEVSETQSTELGIVDAYIATNDTGAVIQTTIQGYGGPILLMTGIDSEGTVIAIKIVSSTETPGLGKRVEETAFTDQFKGLAQGDAPYSDDITTIAGATISSDAVVKSVENAQTFYSEIGGDS